MRAVLVPALLLSFAQLPSPAQTPPALHDVTPDTVGVLERNLHPLAIAEPDIAAPAVQPSVEPVFVTVSYLVSKGGDVQEAVAVSGSPAFRQAAVDGVKHFKYQPYTVDGEPRPVRTMVVIAFQDGVGKRIEPPPIAGIAGGIMSGASGPTVARGAPNPTGPVRVSSGTIAGMLISHPNLVYPPEARAAHVQGTVVMHAIIAKDGTIENLNVISGPPMLISGAMDAVRQWRYRPYLLNDEPVEVETTINVNFTFSGPPPAKDDDQQPQ